MAVFFRSKHLPTPKRLRQAGKTQTAQSTNKTQTPKNTKQIATVEKLYNNSP